MKIICGIDSFVNKLPLPRRLQFCAAKISSKERNAVFGRYTNNDVKYTNFS